MIERLLAAEAALDRGDLDVADRMFGQVADADPRNAIAVVGLARVAARRDEPDEARRLAGRALEIDPDEAAARRLLDELHASTAPEPAPASFAEPSSVAVPASVAAPPRAFWRRWLARILGRG